MIKDLVILAAHSLASRKLRTSLTILGVVIGVAAIVGLIGAVQGISDMILGQVEKFQSDTITVVPGAFDMSFSMGGGSSDTSISKLTDKDVNEIEKIAGVSIVTGVIQDKMTVEYRDEKKSLTILGVDPQNMNEIYPYDISDGRFLSSSDQYSVLIGYSVANDIFSDNVGLKKKLVINSKEFQVVGIFAKVGGLFSSADSMVFIPQKTMKDAFSKTDDFSEIIAKAEKGADTNQIGSDIEYRLAKLHRVSLDKKDFTVITPEFGKQITEQITSLISILIGGIAGISLIVGAIGISNMMFTAVMERTREIGMMKAIGATSNNILMVILIESGIVGLVGGLIGIGFGYVIGEGFLIARQFAVSGISFAPQQTEMPHIALTPELVGFALAFSFIIGLLAGYFPARRASKLQPVEALRYE